MARHTAVKEEGNMARHTAVKVGNTYKITDKKIFVSPLIGVIFKVIRIQQINYTRYARVQLISCSEEVRRWYFPYDNILMVKNIKMGCEKYNEVQPSIL